MTLKQRQPYLLAYDSENPSRRARALKAAGAYSLDPQYSLHEMPLSPGEANSLWQRLMLFAKPPDRILLLARDARLHTVHLRQKPQSATQSICYLG